MSHHQASGQPQDDLAAYFKNSVSTVHLYADNFEHDVVKPAFASSHMFFKERPITATFVAIFSLLSFLPVLSFVGTSLFVAVAVVTFALLAIVLACGLALIAFLSFLLFALFVNFFTALFITGLVTFAYLLLRLAMLVREQGSAGVSHWVAEIQDFLLHSPSVNRAYAALQSRSPVHGSDSETIVAQATPASTIAYVKDEK
ncbi:hypothetical protein JOM56_004139 [Amanita muscaria]